MRRLVIVGLVIALATGCGLFDGKGRKRRARRPFDQPGAVILPDGELPAGSPKNPKDAVPSVVLPEGEPGLVLLFVVDTLRADHVSFCGDDRFITPALDGLFGMTDRVRATCHAYAPATWTLPSHVSMFTGLDPLEHGVISRGIVVPEALTTLAEHFAAKGYQTAAVSANPIVKPVTGLLQGFDHTEIAPAIVSPMHGQGIVRAVRGVLDRLDPSRPTFLFVNLYDAHEPYPDVPEGVSWGEPQPTVNFRLMPGVWEPTYAAFRAGTLSEEERLAYEARLAAGYAQGVHIADRSIGRLVGLLDKQGFAARGVRMVITSDHGEHLGEHGRLRHDGPPFESVSRVPLLIFDDTRKPSDLPEPVSTTGVYRLLIDGQLDPPAARVRATSVAYGPNADPWFQESVALWPSTTTKWMAWEERRFGIDLATDPAEARPLPLEPEAEVALSGSWQALQSAVEVAKQVAPNLEQMRMMQTMGYVEPEEMELEPEE